MTAKGYIYAAVVLALVAGTWTVQEWRWGDKLRAAEEKAEKARKTLATDNAALIEKESKNAAKIIYKTRTIYKTIAKLPASDFDCVVGLRFRSVWNETAGPTGEPSDPLRGPGATP